MAAYASYRHIELDKIGNGKKRISQTGLKNEAQQKSNQNNRITRPPGGESSDIFGSSPTTTPPGTPRKVKNYMASNIFSQEKAGQQQQMKIRQRPENDSFNRLFGANGDVIDGQTTPRGKNIPKGNIAGIIKGEENGHANGHGTNGHTNGTNGHANGHTNGTSNGNTNGHTNGHENGSTGSISSGASSTGSVTPNGSINGDAKSNGSENGIPLTPSRRVPPGGYSSKLW